MAKDCTQNCRLGKVGGEAVLEGVMMRAGDRYSVASRKEDGSIEVSNHTYASLRKKNKFFNLPIIRGLIALYESFKLSFKVLTISAEAQGVDLDEPETKFEKWLLKVFGDKVFNVIMGVAGFFGVLLAIGLFFLLPTAAAKGLDWLAGTIGLAAGVEGLGLPNWSMTLCEGIIRITVFVCYILLVSLMPDIRRTFEYHGAEHKSIACYESGEELTPENAAKHSRFHARCGTSFIFVMLILSVLVFSLPFVPWDNIWLRYAIKLPLMPIICGLGFEFIAYAGKHDNFLTRALSAPGLWMQRVTTREPSLAQLEIALTALKSAMPEEFDPAEVEAVIAASKPQTEPTAEEATEPDENDDGAN